MNLDNCEENMECQSRNCVHGNSTHPINLARIDDNGSIIFENYTKSDIGQCLMKKSDYSSKINFEDIGVVLLIFIVFVSLVAGFIFLCCFRN